MFRALRTYFLSFSVRIHFSCYRDDLILSSFQIFLARAIGCDQLEFLAAELGSCFAQVTSVSRY